jgi:putative transposase
MKTKHTEYEMPSSNRIEQELATIKSPDDFFGEDGVFSRLFSKTINQMLKAEMDEHLGYPKHSPSGYLKGNSRNGSYDRKLKTSAGELDLEVPRDRKGQFQPRR